MKDKVFNMNDKKENYDMTERASERGDEGSTSLARQMESDDASEFTRSGMTPSPDGDSAAENRVATSLNDE